jgi:hypothetical protein
LMVVQEGDNKILVELETWIGLKRTLWRSDGLYKSV